MILRAEEEHWMGVRDPLMSWVSVFDSSGNQYGADECGIQLRDVSEPDTTHQRSRQQFLSKVAAWLRFCWKNMKPELRCLLKGRGEESRHARLLISHEVIKSCARVAAMRMEMVEVEFWNNLKGIEKVILLVSGCLTPVCAVGHG